MYNAAEIRKATGVHEIGNALNKLLLEYDGYRARGLKLDIQRGKPCPEQLDISSEALDWHGDYMAGGVDARSYGGDFEGTPECRRLFGELLGAAPEQVFVWGNSSLNLMYDLVQKALFHGAFGGKPWLQSGYVCPWQGVGGDGVRGDGARGNGALGSGALGSGALGSGALGSALLGNPARKLKFLCPAPGYDRHFAITESLGFELIAIPMEPEGPNMDAVESYVNNDESVVGIWNVPKYSNPTGVTFSDETVRRFAALKPKSDAFRVFWDNAYFAHSIYGEPDRLLNLREEAARRGNPHMVYEIASTSKITFAGGGICVVAASAENIRHISRQFALQSINSDKLNQLRHTRFIKSPAHLREIMARHAEIIRPKFEAVGASLKAAFGANGLCEWSRPTGGYFISVDAPDGCAARALELAAKVGVRFTPAGATYPCRRDPRDRNIRIAPTVPSLEELGLAMEILDVCVCIAYLERKRALNL